MASECTIRTMRRDEVDLAVEWAAAEGWNPGLHDAGCFLAADPQGFLVGELDGEPVAVISAVRYGRDFGFVGFYIVRPGARGRGYGLAIWGEAMRRLEGRNVGLDGVVEQQANYRKSGFELAHRNVRYEGRGSGSAERAPGIVDLASLPFEELLAYDRPFFPAERRAFLSEWIAQPEAAALGLTSGGRLAGYGVRRRCRNGFKIGPLFADGPGGAEQLYQALAAGVPADAPLFLDVPEPNPEAVALAERHGMEVVFETARMYTGPAPALPVGRWYGVTSFELG